MVSKRTNKLYVPVYISKHYRCTITAGTFLYILMSKVPVFIDISSNNIIKRITTLNQTIWIKNKLLSCRTK